MSRISEWNQEQNWMKIKMNNILEAQEAETHQTELSEQANSVAEGALTKIVSKTAKSKKETKLFNKNLKSMLDLMSGEDMTTSITNLASIDTLWINAKEHLDSFATALDTWASKIVTKTVQIKYEEKNKPTSTPSLLDRMSTGVKRTWSSITGGEVKTS